MKDNKRLLSSQQSLDVLRHQCNHEPEIREELGFAFGKSPNETTHLSHSLEAECTIACKYNSLHYQMGHKREWNVDRSGERSLVEGLNTLPSRYRQQSEVH